MFGEFVGPYKLEPSTRMGYQAACRLVMTWEIAHECLESLLLMGLKAQELLKVGCAAGTIRNVWSSIADRHRRFGLVPPLNEPGEFSRMCKAVASVKGVPSRIVFPTISNAC